MVDGSFVVVAMALVLGRKPNAGTEAPSTANLHTKLGPLADAAAKQRASPAKQTNHAHRRASVMSARPSARHLNWPPTRGPF